MNNIKAMSLVAMIFFLLGILLNQQSCKTKPGKVDINKPPKVIEVPYYIERKPDNHPHVNPTVIIKYKDLPPLPSLTPIIIHDTLYLEDTNGKRFRINKEYLLYKPGAPKLIAGVFTGNNLSLDLLDTSGKIQTKTYKLDYPSYDYIWDTALKQSSSHIKIPHVPRWKDNIATTSNLYLTRNPFNNNYQLAVDYSLMYKSLGLYSSGFINYQTQLDPGLQVGLRYKLK